VACGSSRATRARDGELDLIGRDGRGYVVVEVKTRRRGSFVSAIDAVDDRKLARLQPLALAWASEHRVGGRIGLVVAGVTVDRAGTAVDLVEDAG
jgi:Holliday junction resolvase-like predicted endonuclease